jgi:ABC-type multidrug transport system ATPase subunit
LLDEPTSSLDDQARLEIRNTLNQLAQQRTIIVATHSTELLSICRTIIHLERGRVVSSGPAEDALQRLFRNWRDAAE